MRALYKLPGERVEDLEVENTLEALQKLVQGYIEPVTIKDDLVLIVNEEGRLRDMQPNFWITILEDVVVGPAVFVGQDGSEFTDISDQDADWLIRLFEEAEER